MKNLSRKMTLSMLVSGLSLLAACGGSGTEASTDELGQDTAAQAACRTTDTVFSICVNEARLLGAANCKKGERLASYTLKAACAPSSTGSEATYQTITWTCCPVTATQP